MSLDKAIQAGKEWRGPYRGGKDVCKSCRNNGGCPWCRRRRIYVNLRRTERAREDWPRTIEEFYEEFGTWGK